MNAAHAGSVDVRLRLLESEDAKRSTRCSGIMGGIDVGPARELLGQGRGRVQERHDMARRSTGDSTVRCGTRRCAEGAAVRDGSARCSPGSTFRRARGRRVWGWLISAYAPFTEVAHMERQWVHLLFGIPEKSLQYMFLFFFQKKFVTRMLNSLKQTFNSDLKSF